MYFFSNFSQNRSHGFVEGGLVHSNVPIGNAAKWEKKIPALNGIIN
jgi:hypothetical protein